MHIKLSSRSISFYGSVFLALGLLVAPQPSHAGFQWVSPSGTSEQAPAPIGSDPVVDAFPAPQIISAPSETVQATPTKWQDTVSRAQPAVKDEVVRGFADNVPLSVALRQVLPQEVGFSVAQDVSLGTLVSWKGGASWRQVMKDMLLPVGLAIKEQGQLVQVVHATEAQIAAGSTATLPPARPLPSLQPAMDGKPTALVPPPSSAPVPSRSVPDRNAPGGTAGYLAPPTGSASPLPVSMPSPYVMEKTVDAWTGNRGDTLQKVLEDWSRRAHVELSWQAEYDFPLQASVSLTGSYEEAVRGLLSGFQEAKPQPVGYLHNNQAAGQTVLVVQTRGNNYNE